MTAWHGAHAVCPAKGARSEVVNCVVRGATHRLVIGVVIVREYEAPPVGILSDSLASERRNDRSRAELIKADHLDHVPCARSTELLEVNRHCLADDARIN